MSLTILTQDSLFINYDHVAAIHIFGGEMETETGSMEAYQIVADMAVPVFSDNDTPEQQIILGTYLSLKRAAEIADDLANWFGSCDTRPFLFQMPTMDAPEDANKYPTDTGSSKPVNTKLQYRPDEQ